MILSRVTTDPATTGQLLHGWPPRPGKSAPASLCEPDRAFIEDAVAKDRNAMAISRWLSLGRMVTARSHPAAPPSLAKICASVHAWMPPSRSEVLEAHERERPSLRGVEAVHAAGSEGTGRIHRLVLRPQLARRRALRGPG